MSHTDASFTFLHRIEEIEQNIDDRRWQSALALALTLPDICGGIAFPEIVKKYRDGRVRMDKQNNPARDVGAQYIQWYNTYAADYFKMNPQDERPYICGERCWQLRCKYLHQNKGFLNDEESEEIHFHLGVNCGTSVCQSVGNMMQDSDKDIRIDIQEFCLRMCHAARDYYENTCHEKDFGLYNTPVLDFIQTMQTGLFDKRIFIVCEDRLYGEALKATVQNLARQVYVFERPEKGKPDLWIVSSEMLQAPKQPWASGRVPVIILGNVSSDYQTEQGENVTCLTCPVKPNVLRLKVKKLLEGGSL